MPELPEVEYARRELRPAMEGARFVRVLARRPDLRYPFPKDFAKRLEGQHVRAVSRRAKYLLVELASGDVLMMHLGMSGSFRVVGSTAGAKNLSAGAEAPALRPGRNATASALHAGETRAVYRHQVAELEKHDHVMFEMSSGSTVIFNDPRRFGFMKIVDRVGAAGDGEPGALEDVLGPEPLDRAFTAAVLAKSLKGRKTTLKAALLDQRVVGGLGNIYVCEALHRARLSPKRKASTIVTRAGAPTPRAEALVKEIKTTLRDAIAHHHRVSGEDRFRVYDHEGERCPRRGSTGTITRIVQGARSTFYCPVCQR